MEEMDAGEWGLYDDDSREEFSGEEEEEEEDKEEEEWSDDEEHWLSFIFSLLRLLEWRAGSDRCWCKLTFELTRRNYSVFWMDSVVSARIIDDMWSSDAWIYISA